ncbi:archaetidylserine decarboxylase [Nitrincola schmidtii]|uniref:archaetidylserine decarboxylase n=1 Tax=Nitrincola schmidtii TaxID=1730894 RepID=UPI00124E6B20|nr:archaetidylserine decarboxylase [Nitrincola schmidtii]
MKNRLFIFFQYLVPQHLLSRLVGRLADCKTAWVKNGFIRWFNRQYQINMTEAAEENPLAYPSFNAFFTRALKPEARPIDSDPDVLISPADGAISQLGKIEHGRIFQAKGRDYGLTTLLGGDLKRAEPFINGEFATIYLSPKDYHRVHMPISGVLRETVYVPGDLWSVNQVTAEGVDQLFARNERLVAIFDTEIGPMAMVLVGAMIVAGIEVVWQGHVAPVLKTPLVLGKRYEDLITLTRGEEMGRFKLGSTVILLFGENALQWNSELSAGSGVKLGRGIAKLATTQ